MTTYIWNAFSGAWNTGTNWTRNGVPGSGDVALVGAGTVTNGTPDLSNLSIVNEAISVTAANQLTLGNTNLDATTRMVLGNSGTVTIAISGTTTNNGTITVNGVSGGNGGADFYLIPGTGATFNNAGTIDVKQNSRMLGIGTLANTGLFEIRNVYSVPFAFNVIGNDTIANNGQIVIDGSQSFFASDTKVTLKAVQGTGTIAATKAQVTFGGTVGGGQTFQFNDAASSLNLNLGSIPFGATISGFRAGDTIDLGIANVSTFAFAPGSPGTPGTLLLNSATLAFSGSYTTDSFQLTPNGGSDYILTTTVLCFCADTLIATPEGEVKVQQLKVGDRVVTASDAACPIEWIGVGRVLATRGRRGPSTPVIVCKGALGDNVPHHDLRVTKGHSLLFDDVLVPVEFLVNHRSIIWDDRAQEVEIYHVELATHDVLVANGAPAESYRDDGNRWLFQNSNTGWEQPEKPPCVPVLTGGPIVDAIWRRLLDRAGSRPAIPLTDDPDLHLMVDGRRLDAVVCHGAAHMFKLPARPDGIRVVSRAAAPQELGLTRDPRLLGVALKRIVLSQGARRIVVGASHPGLTDGFHEFEPDNAWRWTDGDAVVPASVFNEFDGALTLELRLGAATRYRDEGTVCRAAWSFRSR